MAMLSSLVDLVPAKRRLKMTGDLHFRFDGGVDLEVYNFTAFEIWMVTFPDGTMELSNFQCRSQCLSTGEFSSMEGNVPVWWQMSGLDLIPDAETALNDWPSHPGKILR
jgi:hypothetical protein